MAEILVDLDGTLAKDTSRPFDPAVIGEPITPMVERIKWRIRQGDVVKISTAQRIGRKYWIVLIK